jgi:hypothetical protein
MVEKSVVLGSEFQLSMGDGYCYGFEGDGGGSPYDISDGYVEGDGSGNGSLEEYGDSTLGNGFGAGQNGYDPNGYGDGSN